MTPITDRQRAIGRWANHNFDYHAPQLGMAEELGELAHTLLKLGQKIRKYSGSDATEASIKDAALEDIKDSLADAMIFFDHFIYKRLNTESTNESITEAMKLGQLYICVGHILMNPYDELSIRQFPLRLAELAKHYELDLETITNETWEHVSKRDWRKFPKNGFTA